MSNIPNETKDQEAASEEDRMRDWLARVLCASGDKDACAVHRASARLALLELERAGYLIVKRSLLLGHPALEKSP